MAACLDNGTSYSPYIAEASGTACGTGDSGCQGTLIVSASGSASAVGNSAVVAEIIIFFLLFRVVPTSFELPEPLSFFDQIGLSSGIGAGGKSPGAPTLMYDARLSQPSRASLHVIGA